MFFNSADLFSCPVWYHRAADLFKLQPVGICFSRVDQPQGYGQIETIPREVSPATTTFGCAENGVE